MKNVKEFTMDRKEYIDFLASQSNEISMSNKNSKTGVACLNIAFPVCTCREDITETSESIMIILTTSLNRYIIRLSLLNCLR